PPVREGPAPPTPRSPGRRRCRGGWESHPTCSPGTVASTGTSTRQRRRPKSASIPLPATTASAAPSRSDRTDSSKVRCQEPIFSDERLTLNALPAACCQLTSPSEGRCPMTYLVAILAIAIGVAAIVAGGVDDSPGGQLIGVVIIVGAVVLGVRMIQRSR